MRTARQPIDLLELRLANQKLSRTGFREAADVVSWFGAVQAQDFAGAEWAVGLRAQGLTDAAVQRAFDEGTILRTHVLRPTWHFVVPADIRWMLALAGPRIIAGLASRHRQLDLNARTVARSQTVLARALEGGKHLTRAELATALERARIPCTPERVGHMLAHAELEGLICSGPVRGRQLTYAWLDDRVPPARPIGREEALARLAARYFASHGPATVADFAWWSGLPLRDAKAGIGMITPSLSSHVEGPLAYRFVQTTATPRQDPPAAWLLPNFDEYVVAYKHREAIFVDGTSDVRNTLTHTVIVNGRAAAIWSRGTHGDGASIRVTLRRRLTGAELELVRRAATRYGTFLGKAVTVSLP